MTVSTQKTILMKKADAEKWLAGLRSGMYQQGKSRLCTSAGSFCCLGVLQHVLDGDVERHSSHGTAMHLPSNEWLDNHGIAFRGLTYGMGGPIHSDAKSPFLSKLGKSAANANDEGYTFAMIADAIEADLEYTDEAP